MSTQVATDSPRLGLHVGRLGQFAPAAAWLVGLAAVLGLRHWSACISAAIWGLLLLMSFIAWGACLVRWLGDGRPFGAGLLGTFGIALTLWVFGILACVHLVSVPAVVVWSAAGPVLWAAGWQPSPPARWLVRLCRPRGWLTWKQPPVYAIGLALLAVVAVLQYAHSVMNVSFNTWDDEMAYRSFIQQFLDTGTLLDGFSYRRVGAYGGVSLLQAMVLALSHRDRVHILDNGICLLLPLALIVGYRRAATHAARAAVLLSAFLLLTLPYYLHNLGGEYSGLMFFLALFCLFDQPDFDDASPRNNAILVGLLAAAACTLRQNYIGAAVGFVVLLYLARGWFPGRVQAESKDDARRLAVKEGLAALGSLALFLLPWAVLSTMAIHSPFYPIVRGNVRPDFGILGKVTFDEEVRWTLQNMFTFTPVTSIALFFVAVFTLEPSRPNRAIQVFMFTCVGAFALMMHFFRAFDDAESIARYYFAFTVAFCLATTLQVVHRGLSDAGRARASAAVALVAVAVGYQFVANKDTILRQAMEAVTAFNDLVRSRGPGHQLPPSDVHVRLQATVPPNQPLLVMLDHSYLLDGKRNRIFNYDHPGVMGPGGGPPTFEGPEALAAYLQKQGIRYIAYQMGPSSREYSPDYWRQKMATTAIVNGRGGFYKIQAKFELETFATLDKLAHSRKNLFAEGDIHVLDLQTRR